MRAAVVAGCPKTRASHRGALAVYGVFPASIVEVTVPYSTELTLSGVVVHRSRRPLTRARVVNGIAVTSLERALLDGASVCTEEELECAVEASLRQVKTTEERLWSVLICEGGRGVPGTTALRHVLETRPNGRPARSVLEVMATRLLRRRGIDGFVRNCETVGENGKTYELDFAFLDQRVVLEVDGKAYHSTASQLGRDKNRQRALEAAGWRFLRVGWFDVVTRPEWVVAQLQDLLAA